MRPQGGTGRVFLKTPGGTTIFTSEAENTGVTVFAGGGAWANLSDRNVKENFSSVHAREILEALVALLTVSKGLTLAFCSTLQISNGKIVGGRDYYNLTDVMQQLGLMPEGAAAPA